MRYCPKCGAEYRSGFTDCSDCLVPLVDEPPDGPLQRPGPELEEEDEFDETLVPNLVTVYSADRIQADVVRSVLEGSGIPAMVAREGYAEAYPLTVGAIGEGRVMVREEDQELALAVVRTAVEGGAAIEDLEEEPFARPRWFVVLVTVICIAAVVALIAGVMPNPF